MSENLFKNSNCPIQPVPQVDFDFITVDVCAPIPVPPPIFGCMTPVVPREPDTEVGVLCPVFGPLNVSVNSGYCVNEAAGGTAVIVKTSTDPCEYELALNINVPIPKPPCPIVGDTALTVTSGFADCLLDTNNSFSITSVVVPGDCETADQCLFDFALNIAIPIPRTPCPSINVSSFDVVSGFSDSDCLIGASNRFNVTSTITPGDCNNADQCDFAFDLAIAVPIPRTPCPAINLVDFRVVSGFDDCIDGSNYFRITPAVTRGDCNTPDRCDFDFDVAIAIPIPRVPCPIIRLVDFKFDFGYDDCVTGDTYFNITSEVVPGDCNTPDECAFDFDVAIAIPIPRVPCPTINVVDFKTTYGYSDCTRGDTYFTVTPTVIPGTCNSPDQCAFDIDVAIDFPFPRPPCPTIEIGTFSATTSFRTTDIANLTCGSDTYFRVTPVVVPGDCNTPDQCNFLVDLVIDLPIPRPPCPVINMRAFEVRSGFADPANDTSTPATITGEFVFTDPNGVLPAVTSSGVISTATGTLTLPSVAGLVAGMLVTGPYILDNTNIAVIDTENQISLTKPLDSNDTCFGPNYFSVTPRVTPGDCNTPDQCEFDLDLAINVPIPKIPCPTINVNEFTVTAKFASSNVAGAECDTENRFEITPVVTPGDCATPDQCDFAFDLAIAVPIPRTPCPNIYIGSFSVSSGYSDGELCGVGENAFNVTPVIVPGDCDTPDQCNFALDLAIAIPIPRPPCPTISVGSFRVEAGFAENETCGINNKFEITPTVAEGSCNTPDQCDFTLDLELFIPIPSPACPVIHIDSFNVVAAYEDCLGGENKFDITVTETDAACGVPKLCDYALALELFVPIPKPECPTIRAGKIKVTSGYYECVQSEFSKITITKTEADAGCGAPSCDFQIDLDVVVPLPKIPCPQIFSVATFSNGVSGSFGITPVITDPLCNDSPATCGYLLSLNVAGPDIGCPVILPVEGILTAGYYEQNSINIFVPSVLQDPETKICTIELQPEAHVQIPLPPCTIWQGNVQVQKLRPGADPFVTVQDGSSYAPGDSCVIAPFITIGIPGSCLFELNRDPSSNPKNDIKWGAYADPLVTAPTMSVQIRPRTQSIDDCVYYYREYLTIPKGWPHTGKVDVYDNTYRSTKLGEGDVEIDSNNELKITIYLYTSQCPTTTSGGGTGGGYGYFTARPETAPIAEMRADPETEYEKIQRAVLAGMKKDANGEPVNPSFYTAIRAALRDMLS